MQYKSLNITKIITGILLIFSLFLFSSCFEIVEDISLNNDGSGHVAITINLSQSKTKLHSIMLLDSINGYKIPSEKDIKKHFADLKEILTQTSGISGVVTRLDFDNFIFNVSCDFDNTNALNEVLINLNTKTEAAKIRQHKPFTYNKASKTFSRSYHYDIAKEFSKTNAKDRNIFENASYRTIYHFEKNIKSSSNKTAKISGNKKAIMLLVNAQDLITNKNTIKNKITLN